MNKKRRMKNRETARQLSRDTAPPCPECGQKGPHWVGVPMTLADLMSGTEPEGFWLCDKFYGPDGTKNSSPASASCLIAYGAENVKAIQDARLDGQLVIRAWAMVPNA